MKNLSKNIVLFTVGLFLFGGSFFVGFMFVVPASSEVGLVSSLTEAEVEDLYDGVVFPSDFHNRAFFDQSYNKVGEYNRVNAKSAIVAHHLLVSNEIARIFSMIGSDRTKTVFIIGPNHFSSGVSPAQITTGAWETPYGLVYTDDEIVNELVAGLELVSDEHETFTIEHSIGAVTPFVARSFPNAKIVPIALHETLSDDEAVDLGAYIAEHYKNAVVISSIDMSHNVPIAVQEYHDYVTRRTIASGELEHELEIDANAVMKTLFAINKVRGTQEWHETYHGSSRLMGATSDWRENTSHTIGYFEKGEPDTVPFASLHVVGDIMLDRQVRKIINANSAGFPWENVGRYLMGSHTRIGNLEGTVSDREGLYTVDPPFRFTFTPESVIKMSEYIDVVSLANNHSSDFATAGLEETKRRLAEFDIPWFGSYREPTPIYDEDINGIKLSYIGYHQFQPNRDELVSEIKNAKADGRFAIVFPHWGTEYIAKPQNNQRELAKLMIDTGADLIVGGHPHVAQGIEVIDGVPIVYSLGNFIFDQTLPETFLTFTLGIIIEDDRVILHLLPINTQNSQPTPVNASIAQGLFNKLADISSPELRSSIKTGVVTIDYE
jgi:AmmeMemoRadiSam system protein B